MTWIEKRNITPFDTSPIDGFFYVDGDLLARSQRFVFTKGHKLPAVAFPSGVECSLLEADVPGKYLIHIFGEMSLPVNDTRDSAYRQSSIIADLCSYSVKKIESSQLELYGNRPAEHYIITYDNDDQKMTNIEYLGCRDAKE